MMLEEFISDPWHKSHDGYANAMFSMKPAPEYANSEVMLSSLYRALGFEGLRESEVPKSGRAFEKACEDARQSEKAGSQISVDTWRTVLLGVLESPKRKNQASKKFLQLTPVVPDVALYSGSARLTGTSHWNPGALVKSMIRVGSDSDGTADQLWRRLFDAMSISDSDDIWARWLQEEFELRGGRYKWELRDFGNEPLALAPDDRSCPRIPAVQFARDLEAVIDAKDLMTRRQWVSLLEALLRLASVAHVLWLCDMHDRVWRLVRSALEGIGEVPATESGVREAVVFPERPYLIYGNAAIPIVRNFAQRYLSARLGINLVLWGLDNSGVAIKSLRTSGEIQAMLTAVEQHRDDLRQLAITETYQALLDSESRAVACKKGIGSNIVEFCNYVLSQRVPANDSLRGYDQGYVIRKRADYSTAPWVVSLGPVSVLALVHCCLDGVAGPRSIQWLCAHLACYGVEIDRDDITDSDLGHKLRMLGLVLDSPDAESGMLLVPPFGRGQQARGEL
jgi:hypothetical protein